MCMVYVSVWCIWIDGDACPPFCIVAAYRGEFWKADFECFLLVLHLEISALQFELVEPGNLFSYRNLWFATEPVIIPVIELLLFHVVG